MKERNKSPHSLRRTRDKQHLHNMVSEFELSDLCNPIFIPNDIFVVTEVKNMLWIFYYQVQEAIDEIRNVQDIGVKHFVIPPRLTSVVVVVVDDVNQSISYESKEINLIAHACLDGTKIVDDYFGMALTSDYYGAENKNGNVNLKNIRNKSLIMQFLRILQRRGIIVILKHADNEVAYAKKNLDTEGFSESTILSYCINYVSSLAHVILDNTNMVGLYECKYSDPYRQT